MNEVANIDALVGKPYSVTRSRLGAVTKLFEDKYICDLGAIKELMQSIGEKASEISHARCPEFTFLISFDDKTHRDGVLQDLDDWKSIPIGKKTDRVVMRWDAYQDINGVENNVSVTVRISNPVNPLIYLQAALSKSPNEIDNMEFELASTCVTVNGARQAYADEIFLLVQNWIKARKKPHSFLGVGEVYRNHSGVFNSINSSVIPLVSVSVISIAVSRRLGVDDQITIMPMIIGFFFVIRSFAKWLNKKMVRWSAKSQNISLFEITNGDKDNLTRIAAQANNSAAKLIGAWVFSFTASVAGAVATMQLL